MPEIEFELISPRSFYNKIQGFNELRQAEFELVRMQTVELLNIQMDKKGRITDPQKLWKFGWEKEKKVDRKVAMHSAERFKRYAERIIERGNEQEVDGNK